MVSNDSRDKEKQSGTPSIWRSPLFYLRLGGTIFAAALVVYLFAKSWGEIVDAFQQVPAWLFLLTFAFMMVSRLAVSVRWHFLLRGANLPISFGQSLRVNFAGLFANNFLPTTIGGDVARLAGILLLGYDRAICLASLVVDRLVGMTGMAMILPFALPGFLAPSTVKIDSIAGGVLPVQAGWIEKARRGLKRLWEAFSLWKSSPGSLLAALGYTWLHMACFILIQLLLLRKMGQPTSVWLIAGLWSVTYFVTQLPVSINGWGVQEAAMQYLFVHYGGASLGSAAVLVLSLRILQMLASLPGAFFFSGVFTGYGRYKELAE